MRLIDAHKLQKAFYEHTSVRSVTKETIIGIIKDQPTVDPVKHGRWVDDYNAEENPFFRKGWKCSVCGSRNTYGKPKYCMNCGAQMDGESDE